LEFSAALLLQLRKPIIRTFVIVGISDFAILDSAWATPALDLVPIGTVVFPLASMGLAHRSFVHRDSIVHRDIIPTATPYRT
jgi:hypothetical protein